MNKYPAAIAFLALSCLSVASFGQVAPPARTPVGTPTTPPAVTPPPVTPVAPAPGAPVAQAPAANGDDRDADEGKGGEKHHDQRLVVMGTTAGDVLTVTSITGSLKIGSELSGPGLPQQGIVVTGFLTGTGGVGTYKFKLQD